MTVKPGHTPAAGGALARAMREAEANPHLRKILGIGAMERDGVYVEPDGGILVYIDGTEQLNHQRAVYERDRQKKRSQ